MEEQDLTNQEKLISKLDQDREWILKNIDSGKWPNLRSELAALEREISRFILRVREYNSEERKD